MSDHPAEDGLVDMESSEDLSPKMDIAKTYGYEVEDYTLKRQREHRRVRRHKDYTKQVNIERYDRPSDDRLLTRRSSELMESKEPLENSEEEQVIRLPSETDMTDVSVTNERSNPDTVSNFFSMPGYRRNDCLNFSQQNRELAYIKHSDVFENWKYSDEERAFLRHRVETFTKEQCIIHCVLGHMLMTPEEMEGVRHTMPKPDDARQALLSLAIGSHWDVFNLAIIMAFSEKLNVDGCINKNFQGGPLYSSYHHAEEFRLRVEHYFARYLLDD